MTPGNVAEQPLGIIISADEAGDSVRFTVSVQRKQGKAPPALSAWLGILDGDTRIVSCRVAEEKRDGAVVYEFIVSPKHLAKSKLLFEETDAAQRGLPGGAVYWFYLQDFTPPALGGKEPPKK